MTEIEDAIEKLTLTTTADKVLESLRFLHGQFQSSKGDTTEISLESNILTDLSNLVVSYPDIRVKTEAISLLSVISFNSTWSEPFAVDTYMNLVSNMLDAKNIDLSSKVIGTARHVLETNNIASQSLTSFATLIYSLTQLLQSKETNDKEKESLLKSLLYILDKYNYEDQKSKKKEKEKSKGKKGKGKEKEKEKETATPSSISSTAAAPAPQKKIAPPLPIALTELGTVVNSLALEGGIYVRSHATFVLDIIKGKFKAKIPSLKKKKGASSLSVVESSDDDDDKKSDDDDEDDDDDDDDLPKFSKDKHGSGLVLSKGNRMVTSSGSYQTAFIDLDVSEGIHKISFTGTSIGLSSSFSSMFGAVKKDAIAQTLNSTMNVATPRGCWYVYNNQSYAFIPNATNQTTVTGQNAFCGPGSKSTFGMEYNAEDNTLGFFFNKKPSFMIKNIPKGVLLGVAVQSGSLRIKKYEELDEATFPEKGYTSY